MTAIPAMTTMTARAPAILLRRCRDPLYWWRLLIVPTR